MTVPAAPGGTKTAGRRLWRGVLEAYELDEHELAVLRQAVHVADTCEQLQRRVADDGLLDAKGRPHLALAELRLQRLLLARLLVALRMPVADDGGVMPDGASEGRRPQRRGLRGVYGVRGGTA